MLTKEQRESLRSELGRELVELRLHLREELAAEAGERYRDIAGEVVDLGDEAVGAELAGIDNAIIGRNVREVRDIEAALARMETDKYGRCVDCATDISYGRLTAYPTCMRCERCQAVHEKTFAGEGKPSL